jgi:hypothetical protein
LGETATRDVPGVAARQGLIPRAGGTLENIGINAETRPFLESFPLPNIVCQTNCMGPQYPFDQADGTAEFGEGPLQVTDQNFWTARVDHRISDSDSIFVRFQKDDADRSSPDMNVFTVNSTGSRFTTIEHTHIYSPSLLGQTHLSFNRTQFGSVNTPRAGYDFPRERFTPTDVVIGGISVDELSAWGGGNLVPRNNNQNLWQFKEAFSWTTGVHSTKFGLQFSRFQFNQRGDFYGGGQFNFDALGNITGLENFMRNIPTDATFTSPGSDSHRSWVQWLWGFYLQDDIRVRPGFTLNAGLRYEFVTVPEERWGRSATIRDLRPAHLNVVTPSTTDVGPLFDNPSLKNFAPRIGFAWDVFGSGKTSVRGGIGIFHDQLLSIYWLVPGNRTSPFYAVAELFRQDFNALGTEIDFPDAFMSQSDLLTQFAGRPQIDGIEYEIAQPAVYKYSFDIDHQIATDTTLQVGYTGTRSTHLMRGNLQLNTTPVEIRNGRNFYLISADPDRNNPNFNRFRWRINDGTSDYQGLRTSVTKRFSQGFQIQSSYTWSKSIDDGSAFLGSGDYTNDRQPYRVEKERALSAFDVRHSFYTNFVYELPGMNLSGPAEKILGGWGLSGILRFSAGNPNSISGGNPSCSSGAAYGCSPTKTLIYVDGSTIDLVPGGDLNPAQPQNPDQYFDTTQFVFRQSNCLRASASARFPCDPSFPAGVFAGNVGPNTLIGPGISNLDLTLTKKTAVPMLGEEGNLEFRWELFNVFNRPNFSNPNTTVFQATGNPNPNRGRIQSTRTSSRQMQFALRLAF